MHSDTQHPAALQWNLLRKMSGEPGQQLTPPEKDKITLGCWFAAPLGVSRTVHYFCLQICREGVNEYQCKPMSCKSLQCLAMQVLAMLLLRPGCRMKKNSWSHQTAGGGVVARLTGQNTEILRQFLRRQQQSWSIA